MTTATMTKWTLDPTHTEVLFKVRHLMVSWVSGSFKKFEAEVETDGEDIETAKINFSAELSSIDTNNEQRDNHLRSGDFFDAANHPKISFESTGLEKVKGEKYKLHGRLTMRGTSKPVTLDVDFGGIVKDPWGNTRAGFSVSGTINRKEFGVSYSMLSETGGVLLGDEVVISCNAEFTTK